jgi:hypothetical protein
MKPKTGRDLCPKAPAAKSLRVDSSLCQNGQTQNDQTKPNQARDREPVEEDAGCSPYDPKPIKLTQEGNEESQKKASKAGQIGEIQSENVNSGPQQAYRRHGRELNGALQFVVHFGFSPQPAMGLKIGRDHTHENADLADRGCADWRRGIAARYRLSVFNFAPTWDQFNLISILTPPPPAPARRPMRLRRLTFANRRLPAMSS